MTELTKFLREQALSGANKCARTPASLIDTSEERGSIAERKGLALKAIFEQMPLYIGPEERIVGTMTLRAALEGNEDGHDWRAYSLGCPIKYLNQQDIDRFGGSVDPGNHIHCTPDFSITLKKGIDGILETARQKKRDTSLLPHQQEFLSGVVIVYTGLKNLILRYAAYAEALAAKAEGTEQLRLAEIGETCRNIAGGQPKNLREAIQLLWFSQLGMFVEHGEGVCYGRLDVILQPFLGEMPREEAQQLLECLLIKMREQSDIKDAFLKDTHGAHLVVTLGGVLPNGESAVSEMTMLFLEAMGNVHLPDPEFNLRVSQQDPPGYLEKAAELTVSGCNNLSYFNDDRFIPGMIEAGIPEEYARDYGFDFCQDINIPGKGDFYGCGALCICGMLMEYMEKHCHSHNFDTFFDGYLQMVLQALDEKIRTYNRQEEHLLLYRDGKYEAYFAGIRDGLPQDLGGRNPISPALMLSANFHGALETATDMIFESYPVKHKGFLFFEFTETLNSLAAIRHVVFERKLYTLRQIYDACRADFAGAEGELLRRVLWNAPKWGNDDDRVDTIAQKMVGRLLGACRKYKTHLGAQVLGGIHQPLPIRSGKLLLATPDGRHAWTPLSVTMTPASGTMKNGSTAALRSSAKLESRLIQWNYCIMINYLASVFRGNEGSGLLAKLIRSHFRDGGLQHQPQVLDVEELKRAQLEPEKYKDLIVRLWGVSANFVALSKEAQDEIIERFR